MGSSNCDALCSDALSGYSLTFCSLLQGGGPLHAEWPTLQAV